MFLPSVYSKLPSSLYDLLRAVAFFSYVPPFYFSVLDFKILSQVLTSQPSLALELLHYPPVLTKQVYTSHTVDFRGFCLFLHCSLCLLQYGLCAYKALFNISLSKVIVVLVLSVLPTFCTDDFALAVIISVQLRVQQFSWGGGWGASPKSCSQNVHTPKLQTCMFSCWPGTFVYICNAGVGIFLVT